MLLKGETQEQLSEYALWNLLYGRTEFECRLSWDLSYDVSSVALERACEEAMSYYLFSSYKGWDMYTKDDGNPDSVYGKVKLVYDAPEFDLEAGLGAFRYAAKQDTMFSRKHTMCLVRIRIPLSVPGMPELLHLSANFHIRQPSAAGHEAVF